MNGLNWLNFANNFQDGCLGVYLITNLINNKVYVGISTDLKTRIKKHYHSLCNNAHHNDYLQKSVNKYGLNAFSIQILEYVKEEELLSKENAYQGLYKSTDPDFGYNILITDVNGSLRHTEETKLKIGLANQKPKTEETKLKISIALLGRKGHKHSEEHRRYMSQKMTGRIVSEDTKNKLSLAKKGVPSSLKGRKGEFFHSEESKKLMSSQRIGNLNTRAVKVIDINGQIFDTIKEACFHFKVCRSTIEKKIKLEQLKRIQ